MIYLSMHSNLKHDTTAVFCQAERNKISAQQSTTLLNMLPTHVFDKFC